MTPTQRDWLKGIRSEVRSVALCLEFERLDGMLDGLRAKFHEDVPLNDTIAEVKDMVASVATAECGVLMTNGNVHRAALRRLNEVDRFITESLLATTERNPGR